MRRWNISKKLSNFSYIIKIRKDILIQKDFLYSLRQRRSYIEDCLEDIENLTGTEINE